MRALLQRVKCASVEVGGKIVGSIGPGLLVFLGVAPDDTGADAEFLAKKTANLRIFEDENEKMNNSVLQSGSAVLVISQFTLYADTKKGLRPGFSGAALPALANPLYLKYADLLKENGVQKVEKGIFGADMLVKLENDGPATFLLESK